MALNEQMLREQTDLGLTDAQITAIAALSQKDEDIVFPQKFGEMLGNMDTMIAAKSSITRNEGEKTTEYMGRVLGQLKSAADEGATLKTDKDALTAEVERLKKQIESGAADAELKQRVAKLEGDLASAKKINTDLQDSLTKSAAEYKGKLEGYRMESEIGAAMTGIAMKKELPEATKQALLTLAKQNVMASKHVFDETAGVFIFQDADGNPMKDKSLNNLTVADMLRVQLETMGVLDTGRQQGGAGGNGNAGGGGGADVNISSARSKVEADEMIEKQLMAQGHAKSDANWTELVRDMRASVKGIYDTLPLN